MKKLLRVVALVWITGWSALALMFFIQYHRLLRFDVEPPEAWFLDALSTNMLFAFGCGIGGFLFLNSIVHLLTNKKD